jgi:hypothetical protein
MVEALKVLHFLALAVALGGGVANLALRRQAMAAEPAARPALGAAQKRLALFSAVSVGVLWLTGIALVETVYGVWTGFPAVFWAKIAAATVWLAAVTTGQVLMRRPGPPSPLLKPLGMGGMASALLTLVLAVLAFTY